MGESSKINLINQGIKDKLPMILFMTLSFALVIFILTFFIFTREYESRAKFVIHEDDEASATVQLNEEDLETFRNDLVLDDVVKQLSLKETIDQLDDKLIFKVSTNSDALFVSVLDENPDKAASIANATINAIKENINEFVEDVDVVMITEAKASSIFRPTKPNTLHNVLWAVLIGFILSIIIASVLSMRNKTFKTKLDLEEQLALPVLGEIHTVDQKNTLLKKYRRID